MQKIYIYLLVKICKPIAQFIQVYNCCLSMLQCTPKTPQSSGND